MSSHPPSSCVRSYVNGIVATDRGYTKIFFVTSSAARAKDRARVEDELSRLYGVRLTIHDRAWIINEVIDKNRLDLAVNYLKIGDETDDLALGPSDYSRKQQLADIERELEDPSAFVGMKMQRASEALLAAALARGLELPRTDVGGRFLRAVRLADDGGTYRQQLTARYESLWTAFWWFDDLKAILDGYEGSETRVIDDENAINLEMLCNLLQLLFNMVIHRHRTPEEVRLEPRIARLSSRLAEMASDSSRPHNALEARTSLLTIQLNEAFIFGEPEQVSSLWPQSTIKLVRSNPVVPVHQKMADIPLSLLDRRVAHGRYPLGFQAPEHPLHWRIIPTISSPAHALTHAISPKALAKAPASILQALVEAE